MTGDRLSLQRQLSHRPAISRSRAPKVARRRSQQLSSIVSKGVFYLRSSDRGFNPWIVEARQRRRASAPRLQAALGRQAVHRVADVLFDPGVNLVALDGLEQVRRLSLPVRLLLLGEDVATQPAVHLRGELGVSVGAGRLRDEIEVRT